jgi:hypothetical protein
MLLGPCLAQLVVDDGELAAGTWSDRGNEPIAQQLQIFDASEGVDGL